MPGQSLRKIHSDDYDIRMQPHVVVLGCGFGGLFAARAGARAGQL
jgi:hypothetical protein